MPSSSIPRRRCAALALAVVGVCAINGPAKAEVITPVQAVARSFYPYDQTPLNLISSVGLDISSGNTATMTQAPHPNASTMWHANSGSLANAGNFIVFDLGANYDLTAADLWQFAQTNLTSRGIRNFTLMVSSADPAFGAFNNSTAASYSTDGFTTVVDNATLQQAANSTPVGRQRFTLSGATSVRQVYLQIHSVWNNSSDQYAGLSKVRFEGQLSAPAVVSTWTPGVGYSSPLDETTTRTDIYFATDSTQTVIADTLQRARSLTVSAGDYTFRVSQSGPPAYYYINTLNVVNGAAATVHDFYTSNSANNFAANNINVDGAGSTLTVPVANFATLGPTAFGAGRFNTTLKITNGGVATFDDKAKFGSRNGSATVIVDGVGSRLRVLGAGPTGDANNYSAVGFGAATADKREFGHGTMAVTNGASAEFTGDLGIGHADGRGFVYVGKTDGSDTAVSSLSARSISVGSTGLGELHVGPKGRVTVSGDLASARRNVLFLNGGSVQASRLNMLDMGVAWTSGTLTLTGSTASVYGGDTFPQTLEVPANGALRGNHTFGGHVTIANGGTFSPGNTEGAIGAFGIRNLVLRANSLLDLDVDVAGNTSDQVVIAINATSVYRFGTAKLNLDFSNLNLSPNESRSFLLINQIANNLDPQVSTSLLFDPAMVTTNLPSSYTFELKLAHAQNVNLSGNDLFVTITAVPEPTLISLLTLPALVLLRRRRA